MKFQSWPRGGGQRGIRLLSPHLWNCRKLCRVQHPFQDSFDSPWTRRRFPGWGSGRGKHSGAKRGRGATRGGSRGGVRGGAAALLRNSSAVSAARSLTPGLRLHSSLLLTPTLLRASPGVCSPGGGGGCEGGAAAGGGGTAWRNPGAWKTEEGVGRVTSRGFRALDLDCLRVPPLPLARYSPSPPERDPEVKPLGVTAQRRCCAPPRPSCSRAGSPGAPASAGEETGEGKGK